MVFQEILIEHQIFHWDIKIILGLQRILYESQVSVGIQIMFTRIQEIPFVLYDSIEIPRHSIENSKNYNNILLQNPIRIPNDSTGNPKNSIRILNIFGNFQKILSEFREIHWAIKNLLRS